MGARRCVGSSSGLVSSARLGFFLVWLASDCLSVSLIVWVWAWFGVLACVLGLRSFCSVTLFVITTAMLVA